MKVLCVHHKGGVGKTTTAIHLTGVFLAHDFQVLLIDCDSQADSYKFFTEGIAPKLDGKPISTQEGKLTLISAKNKNNVNNLAKDINKLARDEKFNHVVIDISTDLPNISTILVEIQPDLVILSVKRDDIGSFKHLNDMLMTLEQARPILGSSLTVKILPIGVNYSEFKEYIDTSFKDYDILDPVDWQPIKVGKAVFINYDYIWNQTECEDFWNYYKKIVME